MLITSIITLFAIFILNLVVGLYYGFGTRHYWFFQTLHFLGGFFITMFFSNFSESTTLILISLGIVTVLWESMEFLIAYMPKASNYMKNKFRLKNVSFEWKDTIFDIILNFSGAIFFFFLFR